MQADLANVEAVQAACCQQDVVFHCGARASDWGSQTDFFRSNVLGTRHVIRGCQIHAVKRLVHVSTPSIYFYYRPRLDIREDDPLPNRPMNEYAHSKRLAEQEVDRAFKQGLQAVTIRPSAVFGPGDRIILPRIIDRLQRGVLPIIGDGSCVADLTYVENVVDALILCAGAPDPVVGRKYNITNGEPVHIWRLIEQVCNRLRLPPPARRVPYALADTMAWALEAVWRAVGRNDEPPLTRYSVARIGLSSSLDISAAKRDLGYIPRISLDTALNQTLEAWRSGGKLMNTESQQ